MRSILKKIYRRPLVKKAIIDFVSIFNPPPYRRDMMELEFEIWTGITAIHCENNRQLGENNTFPAFYHENISTEYHKSSFEGSRAGHMMNMTALHAVMNRWSDAIAVIGAIRHCYMQRYGIAHKQLMPAELYILAKTCSALPAFIVRRFEHPVRDGKIPASIAAEFKITAGMFMVLRKMMENGICWTRADRPISGEEFFDYADRHNVLISSSGHACAGSRRKIIELADYMIEGVDEISLREGMAELAGLVFDINAFLEYSIQALTLESLIILCRSMAAKAFIEIDLNFLQDGRYKRLAEDHAHILNRIREIYSIHINLDCQIQVLYDLLEKLNGGSMGREFEGRVNENGCEYMEEIVKQMTHLPEVYRISFAEATGKYLKILSFLCGQGEILQNRIFSTLGRTKTSRFSVRNAERCMGIVSRRSLEKIAGFDVVGRFV